MHQLNQYLSQLNLTGVKEALERQQQQSNMYSEMSFVERLTLLLEDELTRRTQRKVERLTRQAKFRVRAAISDINYQARRNLNKQQIIEVTQSGWLEQKQNLILTGATGCGKTWLSCAIGHHYCSQGQAVFYFRLKELLEKMYLAQAEGSYRKLVIKLSQAPLLILDDWGLEPLNQEQRSDLLELVDLRYENKSTIISSQLPIEHWFTMIGESTFADAILDRLIHSSVRIELKGESMRKSQKLLTEGDHLE